MATLFHAKLRLPELPDAPDERLDDVHARVQRLTGLLEGTWSTELDRDGPVVRGHRQDAGRTLSIELFPGWTPDDEDPEHWALWVRGRAAVDIDRGGAALGVALGVGVSGVVWFGLYSLVPLGFQLALPIAILAFLGSAFVLSVAIPILLNKAIDKVRGQQLARAIEAAIARSADLDT